jgi:hypothetical protein
VAETSSCETQPDADINSDTDTDPDPDADADANPDTDPLPYPDVHTRERLTQLLARLCHRDGERRVGIDHW